LVVKAVESHLPEGELERIKGIEKVEKETAEMYLESFKV